MIANLTKSQLEVATWLAKQVEEGLLPETFSVQWSSDDGNKTASIKNYKKKQLKIAFAVLEILEQEGLIQTLNREMYEPMKIGNQKPVFKVRKWETGRTYTIRNDIFKAKELFFKRALIANAENIISFMISRPPGKQFATRQEIMSDLQINDEIYEKTCQFLEDFDLIEYRASSGILWGYIQPTQRGRQIMHEKSMESLLISQQTIINYHSGDQINVNNTGENVAIAAGNNSRAKNGLSPLEIEELIQLMYEKLEDLKITDNQKQEVKETIELIEGEIQNDIKDEKALKYYFRTLARMAPDILDVVIASASDPILGGITVVRKIAEKAKSESQNNR